MKTKQEAALVVACCFMLRRDMEIVPGGQIWLTDPWIWRLIRCQNAAQHLVILRKWVLTPRCVVRLAPFKLMRGLHFFTPNWCWFESSIKLLHSTFVKCIHGKLVDRKEMDMTGDLMKKFTGCHVSTNILTLEEKKRWVKQEKSDYSKNTKKLNLAKVWEQGTGAGLLGVQRKNSRPGQHHQ